MKVGVYYEHAAVLDADELERTVTDYTLLQIRNGDFGSLRVRLVFKGARLIKYYVGKSPLLQTS